MCVLRGPRSASAPVAVCTCAFTRSYVFFPVFACFWSLSYTKKRGRHKDEAGLVGMNGGMRPASEEYRGRPTGSMASEGGGARNPQPVPVQAGPVRPIRSNWQSCHWHRVVSSIVRGTSHRQVNVNRVVMLAACLAAWLLGCMLGFKNPKSLACISCLSTPE